MTEESGRWLKLVTDRRAMDGRRRFLGTSAKATVVAQVLLLFRADYW